MKRILLIHPFLPYPLVSGGHQALFNGIKAIEKNNEITLAFEGNDDVETRKNIELFSRLFPTVALRPLLYHEDSVHDNLLSKVCKKIQRCLDIIVRFGTKQNIVNYGQQSNSFIDVAWWKTTVVPSSETWINHIYRVSREKEYDIIQVEMPWRISDILALPENPKKIFIHHEIGIIRRNLEIEQNPGNPYYHVCKYFVDYNEIALLNLYDSVVTLSAIDSQKLQNLGVSVPIYTSFAVVDSSKNYKCVNFQPNKLCFVGYGNHAPNIVGLLWFLNNCWNNLKRINPSLVLDVIGKWDNVVAAELVEKYKDIRFLGFVENLYDAISGHIMIVPITVGSGIRMKILEAASLGVPVVTTSIGVEGTPFKDGEECFIADDPENFAQRILRLRNQEEYQKIANGAFNMVKEAYSLDSLQLNRENIYNQLLRGVKA